MKDNQYLCPNCGKITNANVISFDEFSWHTNCIYCDSSFDISIEEIANDVEEVLIMMSQEQFIDLILKSDRKKEIAFCADETGEGWYAVQYVNFLDTNLLGIGGYGQNTRMLDIEGFGRIELTEYITDFVKDYLKDEGFNLIFIDSRYVNYKEWVK